MRQSKLRSYLSRAVLLASVFFIFKIFFNYFGETSSALSSIPFNLILLSALFYLVYFYLRALSWHFIIKSLKGKLKIGESFSVWFLGEATRYIPGNIWSFASRVYLGNKKGVPKTLIFVSLSIEAFLLVTSTFILSIPGIRFSTQAIPVNAKSLLILFIFILAGAFLAFFIRNKIMKTLKTLQKIPLQTFISPPFLQAFFLHLLSWVFFGVGTYVLMTNLVSSHQIFFISLIILSWLLGYLSFITPMGLGVREGVQIALLSPFIGVGSATLIALLSRLIMTVVDVGNVGAWLFVIQKKQYNIWFKWFSKNWDLVAIWVFIFIYVFIFSVFSILRHDAFASNFDLANMDQTIWNSLHGHIFFMSDQGKNITRLATHSDFILVLLAPLYALWDNVRLLLIFQSALLGLGAIPVCLLAKKLFSNKILLVTLPLLYLLNPGLQWANIYDFHGVTLAIPFVLFGFYFGYTKKWKWYWVFFVLALITKEEISLLLAGMGFFLALFQKSWKSGLLSFLIGTLWFPLMIFIVIPHFSPLGEHWAFSQWFSVPKHDLDQNNFLDLTKVMLSSIVSHKSFKYYLLLLKPFGFLPIIGLPWVLITTPELLINIVSTHPGMQSITMHYQSGIIPGFVIGLIFGTYYIQYFYRKWFLKKFPSFKKPFFLKLWIPLIAVVLITQAVWFDFWNSPLPFTPCGLCDLYSVDKADMDFEKALSTIPPNASIAASGEVRPHLTHRVNAFNLPDIPKGVDYYALIDQNRVYGNFTPHKYELKVIKKLAKDPNYTEIFHEGHFYLYKKVI